LIEAEYRTGQDRGVRSAVIAMGRSANSAWAAAVKAEMASPSPAIREAAARAAGAIELRDTVPTLIELLDDVSDAVRRASIWSLGQLGSLQAERALQTLLRRKPPEDEAALLEEALENLAFVDGTREFLMLDLDGEEGEAS
jgi:HEAT repeat protein